MSKIKKLSRKELTRDLQEAFYRIERLEKKLFPFAGMKAEKKKLKANENDQDRTNSQ